VHINNFLLRIIQASYHAQKEGFHIKRLLPILQKEKRPKTFQRTCAGIEPTIFRNESKPVISPPRRLSTKGQNQVNTVNFFLIYLHKIFLLASNACFYYFVKHNWFNSNL